LEAYIACSTEAADVTLEFCAIVALDDSGAAKVSKTLGGEEVCDCAALAVFDE
jgi:hypothetical protein